jgi:hypothetical protein
MDTPNFNAMPLIVSPDLMVYVKGVGLGRGVFATMMLLGV